MRISVSCAAVVLALVASVSACSKRDNGLTWTAIDLPGAAVSAVASCGDQWWVVGAKDGAPAAWVADTSWHFRQVPFVPTAGSYYGPLQTIDSVACDGGRVAMIGSVPGGAHGIPRVSTWRLGADGKADENLAPFENYGGDEAVGIGPVAAGPRGFAIATTRSTGAAVVLSADGIRFDLHDKGAGKDTVGRDAAELPDGRWLVVGGARAPGQDEHAAAWVTDGTRWEPETLPGASAYSELQNVVREANDLVIAGASGTRFVIWRRHDGVWSQGAPFGGDPRGVRSLTLAGDRTVVAGGGLWINGERAAAPVAPESVAGAGDALLLAGGGHVWRTTMR